MFDDKLQRLTAQIQKTGHQVSQRPSCRPRASHDAKATGDSYVSMAFDFLVAAQSEGMFLQEVCNALLDEYKGDVMDILNTQGMKWPTNL